MAQKGDDNCTIAIAVLACVAIFSIFGTLVDRFTSLLLMLLLFPGEQSPFPFELSDMGAILHHLHHSPESPILVSYGHIDDIDKASRLVDPKLRFTLLAATKFFDDLLYQIEPFGWMAITHLSSDHSLATREDTMFGIGIEFHQVVLIHERDVYR